MDEKKVREAIDDFKELSGYMREAGYCNATKHCDLAIEALEKQLPKKPIEKGIHFVYYKCPNCNRILPIDKNYCDRGQKLDW